MGIFLQSDEQKPPDVAKIMAKIQWAVAERQDLLERQFTEPRKGLEKILHPEDFALLNASQGQANEIFQAMTVILDSLPPLEPEPRLREMATSVPGAKAAWYQPKRWLGAIRQRLLARQEAFNLEIASRIRRVEDASLWRKHFEVTTRLLGTLNTLVRRTIDTDRARLQWNTDLLERLWSLFYETHAKIDETVKPQDKEPPWVQEVRNLFDEGYDLGEVRKMLNEVSVALMDHVGALSARLREVEAHGLDGEGMISDFKSQISSIEGRLSTMVSRGAPSTGVSPRSIGVNASASSSVKDTTGGNAIPQFDFLAFEGLTRGHESVIADQQTKYAEIFAGAENVLDAGCGRGEFLEVLRNAGIEAHGVDMDASMVEHCVAKGLDVYQGDLINHIERLPDESLGGMFLGQVVEHLQPSAIAALAQNAFKKLKPGAAIVMETINPQCLTTFSGAFYADPTHVKPLHPKALEYFLASAGFDGISVIYSAPVPEDGRLAPLKETAPLEPAVKEIVLQANSNFDRLNTLLYSYANYAIVGRKPA